MSAKQKMLKTNTVQVLDPESFRTMKTEELRFIKSTVTTVVVLVVERVMEKVGRREGEQGEASVMTKKKTCIRLRLAYEWDNYSKCLSNQQGNNPKHS